LERITTISMRWACLISKLNLDCGVSNVVELPME